MKKLVVIVLVIVLAICAIDAPSPETNDLTTIDWVAAEYECQMLLAETSDMEPELIVEACQP